MMMPKRGIGHLLQLLALQQVDTPHPRRRPQMIHDRVSLVEAFRRDDVLVVDAFVLVTRSGAVAMEPDVVLPRNFAESLIMRHVFSLLFLLCHSERSEESLIISVRQEPATVRDVSLRST